VRHSTTVGLEVWPTTNLPAVAVSPALHDAVRVESSRRPEKPAKTLTTRPMHEPFEAEVIAGAVGVDGAGGGPVPERQVNPSVHGAQQVVARVHDDRTVVGGRAARVTACV